MKSDINLKKKGKELAKVSGKSRIYQMGWKKRKGKRKGKKRKMNAGVKYLTRTAKRVMNLKEKGKEQEEIRAKSSIYHWIAR